MLPDLIREQMAVLGIETQADLRRALGRAGVDVSSAAVSGWCTGRLTPRPQHLGVLLDILGVHGPRRDAAYRLAYEVEP